MLDEKQKKARELLLKNKRLYLSWSIGTGKTYFCATITKEFMRAGKKIHIVCPKGVMVSFEEEFQKMGVNCYVIDSKEKRVEVLSGRIDPKVVIMTLDFFRNHYTFKHTSFQKPDLLILDECHNFKSPKSSQSKKARVIARNKIDYILLASGTPIGNSLADIWNQIYILDEGIRLGESFYGFQHRYFVDLNSARRGTGGYFPKLVPKSDAFDKILYATKDIMYVNEGEDIKMPEVNITNILVPQSDKQRLTEHSIKMHGAIELGVLKEDKLRLTHTLEVLAKLRQVACGFLYTESKAVLEIEHSKLVALRRCLELCTRESDESKVLVWSVFKHTYKQIMDVCKELGLGCANLTGGLTTKKFSKNVKAFKNDPNIRVALLHPKSGGAGLNLQIARNSIVYSQDYSYIDKVQREGRNYRRGSADLHKQVNRIHLVCKDSIEDYIRKALEKKENLVESFKKELLALYESI